MRQDELEGILGDLWPLVGPYADEVVGGHWPHADEDACFDRSGALAAAAKALAGVARDGDAAHAAVTACMDGAAAENFTAHWTRFTTRDPRLIPAATAACELAAGRLHRYGADVEYAKYLIVGVLAGLAHRIARLRAMGSASFGGSLGLIPEACAAGRITVQRLAATLVALQADDARPAGADATGAGHPLTTSGGHAGEPLDDALAAGYVPPRTGGPDLTGHPFDGAEGGTAGPAANARTPEFHHLGGIDWQAGAAAPPHGNAGTAASPGPAGHTASVAPPPAPAAQGTAGHSTTSPPQPSSSHGTVRHDAGTAPPQASPPHAAAAADAGAVPVPGDGGAPGASRISDLLNGAPGDGTALASASGPDASSGPAGSDHHHGDGTGDGTGTQAPASPPQAPPVPMPMFMPVMPMTPSAPSGGGSPKPTPKFRRAPHATPGNGPDAGGAAASGTGRTGRGGGRSAAGGATPGRGATGKGAARKGTTGKGTARDTTGRRAIVKGTTGRGPAGRGGGAKGIAGRGTDDPTRSGTAESTAGEGLIGRRTVDRGAPGAGAARRDAAGANDGGGRGNAETTGPAAVGPRADGTGAGGTGTSGSRAPRTGTSGDGTADQGRTPAMKQAVLSTGPRSRNAGRGIQGTGSTGRGAGPGGHGTGPDAGSARHGTGPTGRGTGSGGRDAAPGDGSGTRGTERRGPERDG